MRTERDVHTDTLVIQIRLGHLQRPVGGRLTGRPRCHFICQRYYFRAAFADFGLWLAGDGNDRYELCLYH